MEYPDPEEEFELLYADELDILNEMQNVPEEPIPRKSKRSLDFSTSSQPNILSQGNSSVVGSGIEPLHINHESLPSERGAKLLTEYLSDDAGNSGVGGIEALDLVQASLTPERDGKRTIEDLFGDICDIEEEDIRRAKRMKKDIKEESEEELIARILALKNEAHKAVEEQQEEEWRKVNEKIQGKITRRIPSGPFQTLISGQNIKLYVQLISEKNFEAEVKNIVAENKKAGLLSVPYSTLHDQALVYLDKKVQQEETRKESVQSESLMEVDSGCETCSEEEDGKGLWVEKYKPKRYLDLLSDETSNRTLLRWLKLWDMVVFNRECLLNALRQKKKKYTSINILDETFDQNNCPKQKVVLLSGPPGLGKTTLAHLVAKHAGYNVVEVNASDDRSPEAFRLQLEAATQMKAVMGKDPRPNCLVLDEIDGAPAAAIELLVKFVEGQDSGGGIKKVKKKKQSFTLKRPIICICNDLYAPALRPLKQIALVIQMPIVKPARIAERLMYILRRQRIKADTYALMALAEKTNNDIRSCLSALQYFKASKKSISLADIVNANIGQKDMHVGLFRVWQEIFQITRPKWYALQGQKDFEDIPLNDLPLSARMTTILHTVRSCGDYERLAQGVFENYPTMKFWDCRMERVSSSLEWFCDVDCMNHHMHTTQNYVSLAYIPYAFVKWHFIFGSTNWPKIKYPSAGYDASVKSYRMKQVLKQLVSGMTPSVRIFNSSEHSLLLDTVPLLMHVISPELPPVNTILYTPKQKEDLQNLMRIMLEYNLRYIQQRTVDGGYDYMLDPNLDELVRFSVSTGSTACPKLTYVVKQLIAREVNFAYIQRNENVGGSETNAVPAIAEDKTKLTPKSSSKDKLLKKSKGKSKTEETLLPRMTDFFQLTPSDRSQSLKPHQVVLKDLSRSKVWYHFKEGFSNAVRKPVKMKELLRK